MHLSVRVMLRHVVLIRQSAAAKALKQPVQAPAHSVREVQGGKTAYFYSLSVFISASMVVLASICIWVSIFIPG